MRPFASPNAGIDMILAFGAEQLFRVYQPYHGTPIARSMLYYISYLLLVTHILCSVGQIERINALNTNA